MSDDILSSAIAALRDSDGGDVHDGDATHARLVRSLEVRVRRHRQLVSAATIAAVLVFGGVSWAWTTGRLQAWWSPARPHASEPEPREEAPSVPMHLPQAAPRHQHASTSALPQPPEPPAEVAPPPEPPPPPPPAPVKRPAPRAPFEPLYRKAHEIHFRGGDPAAALVAWDAYLAAEPTGRFASEARFNRGLVLVKLGRYAEARDALAPFARGELGYRQREASQLVERLDQLLGSD